MLKIAIIVGSTRPGRQASAVASWILDQAKIRGDADYEILDIESFALPLLDEPIPPVMGRYVHAHTKAWAAAVASYDAYIFVTPEYNHSVSGALKNAIDFVANEWADKAAGFVSYGGALGARAVEHLRGITSALQIAGVQTQVGLSMYDDFENFTIFKPRATHAPSVARMLDQVIEWGGALSRLRQERSAS